MSDNALQSLIQRRSFLRALLFGTGAAAVAPVLAGLPGVSVQAMGLSIPGNVRVAHLTGTVLEKAINGFSKTSAYQHGISYLKAKNAPITAPVDSGMDVFTETGGAWSTTEILVRDMGHARLISVRTPQELSMGLVISDGAGRHELANLDASGAKPIGAIIRSGGVVTVEMEGHAPVTLTHAVSSIANAGK